MNGRVLNSEVDNLVSVLSSGFVSVWVLPFTFWYYWLAEIDLHISEKLEVRRKFIYMK